MVYTQGAMNPANVMDPYNYVRPTNQLVFLLQKGLDMPPYPIELSDSIPEKVWYSRMDKLHAALARAWHWTEKALFSFAFVMSIVMVSLMTLRDAHKLTSSIALAHCCPYFTLYGQGRHQLGRERQSRQFRFFSSVLCNVFSIKCRRGCYVQHRHRSS